ncbi:pyridoxal phosphate-dependent decarboxylase family protein [Agromyces albus]|uniref:pyridoxal phosphate-dependent decarboxylase family protein n=1 Tax=Agromyces albus TaxID=205332 RepID=UPI0027872CCE|nr:pyridoxal-dependent decarboxylase [Agromyces albus]MDQ0575009.1 glutamate/tyrosine decarboxylase-like PLP-dependent enzyme [Agromyces albus]
MSFQTRETKAAAAGDGRYDAVLDAANDHARAWLSSVFERKIPASATIEDLKDALGRALPDGGEDPVSVISRLAVNAEPGLMAIGSPRFFGWVMGGTQPVALAADWLAGAWDQNAGLRFNTPGVVAAEELAGEWIVDLLGLPSHSEVGFTTGATMGNFTCLAAARDQVLREAGWDVERDGLAGGPRVRFIVGEERHGTVDLAARYLGLGSPIAVPADEQGRIEVGALRETLAAGGGPTIVVLQAGNIHSGAFDDFSSAIDAAHEVGAWVHIDGAFGLWAGATPSLRHLVAGYERADSWATDSHKTLSVTYDCGIAIVARPDAMHRAFSMHASYLQTIEGGADPHEKVPELSRRARGIPTWAVLRALGRDGVAGLVDGLVAAARGIADGVAELPGIEVLNEVVFTQVCIALPSDAATAALSDRLWADGEVLALTSQWQGRTVVRFSVSNWATDAEHVARTVGAVRRAVAEA